MIVIHFYFLSGVRHYWAEYLESVEDLEGAMIEYESCGDIHSQVRVLQLLGDTQRAIEVVEETRDKAAAYYLAQKLSDSQEVHVQTCNWTRTQFMHLL